MPSNAPPPDYVDLATAQSSPVYSNLSVIGVVVDCMPPTWTRGSDLAMNFKLQDPRLRNTLYSGEGLKVRFFGATEDKLPRVKAKGDIVLLRGVGVRTFANEVLLLSSNSTGFLVFSGSNVPAPALKLGYVSGNSKLPCHGNIDHMPLTPAEQDYIITLKSEMEIPVQPFNPMPAHTLAAPNAAALPDRAAPTRPGNLAAPTGPAGGVSRKFKLVKNLEHRVFSDVYVEVVKKFTNNYGNCELYVTDYTENKNMFYYAPPEEKPSDLVHDGDNFGYIGPPKRQWPGPYGFLVLKVNLTEPHASFANQNITEGDMITLENVKIKVMPDTARLEGDMWPDKNNPSKVQVRKLRPGHKAIQELCVRKEEYWAFRRAKTEAVEKQVEAGLSKKQKKKQRLKREKEEARQKAEKEAAVAEKKITSNDYVRCTYKDQPLTTISHILDILNTRHTNTSPSGKTYLLPFINARHHIKARVVDFYPPDLADFAVQISIDDDNNSEYSMDMSWQEWSPRWEWSFALQVEEVSTHTAADKNAPPPNRIWLNVSHMEAQHLLGNAVEDPADLREDTALLNQLREKLYILWGDLEERKRDEDKRDDHDDDGHIMSKRAKLDEEQQQQQPSNLPFNCCLQEYGVLREGGRPEEIADWERQYMMFGVTIS